MKPATLHVQIRTKTVVVKLYLRGIKPAHWNYCFWLDNVRYRASTHQTELQAAQLLAQSAVLKASAEAPSGIFPLAVAVETYLDRRWPGLDRTLSSYELPRRFIEAEEKLERFKAWAIEKQLTLDLGTLDIDALTGHVQAFLDDRKKAGRSAQTLRNDQRMLSAFFSWILRTADIRAKVQWRANPADSKFLTLPTVVRRPKPPASIESVELMLEKGRTSSVWPALMLCLTAGLRPSTAGRTRWDAVDLRRALITVEEKGRRRTVSLVPWVCSELSAWRNIHTQDLTLCHPSRDKMRTSMKAIRRAAGIKENVTLQSLRRSFIARCYAAGVNAHTVAGIAGNSAAVIERHYLDLATMDQKQVMAVMGKLKPSTEPATRSATRRKNRRRA